jgi:hypothetical protein
VQGMGGRQLFPEQPARTNDNDCRSPLPGASQQSNPRGSTALTSMLLPPKRVTTTESVQIGRHSSWRVRLSNVAFVAAVSTAQLGWLYLIWLALVSSVKAVLT